MISEGKNLPEIFFGENFREKSARNPPKVLEENPPKLHGDDYCYLLTFSTKFSPEIRQKFLPN